MTEDLAKALAPIEGALRADGYQLTIHQDLPQLRLRVEAGPDACADCLVPKELFGRLVIQALASSGIETHGVAVDVTYPADAA
jgi:hypothetical protein